MVKICTQTDLLDLPHLLLYCFRKHFGLSLATMSATCMLIQPAAVLSFASRRSRLRRSIFWWGVSCQTEVLWQLQSTTYTGLVTCNVPPAAALQVRSELLHLPLPPSQEMDLLALHPTPKLEKKKAASKMSQLTAAHDERCSAHDERCRPKSGVRKCVCFWTSSVGTSGVHASRGGTPWGDPTKSAKVTLHRLGKRSLNSCSVSCRTPTRDVRPAGNQRARSQFKLCSELHNSPTWVKALCQLWLQRNS